MVEDGPSDMSWLGEGYRGGRGETQRWIAGYQVKMGSAAAPQASTGVVLFTVLSSVTLARQATTVSLAPKSPFLP